MSSVSLESQGSAGPACSMLGGCCVNACFVSFIQQSWTPEVCSPRRDKGKSRFLVLEKGGKHVLSAQERHHVCDAAGALQPKAGAVRRQWD